MLDPPHLILMWVRASTLCASTDLRPYKHIFAQFDQVFERRLSSRCAGTFLPRTALLRAAYFRCRVRFHDLALAYRTALIMRADAFAPCSSCAGTSVTTPSSARVL